MENNHNINNFYQPSGDAAFTADLYKHAIATSNNKINETDRDSKVSFTPDYDAIIAKSIANLQAQQFEDFGTK